MRRLPDAMYPRLLFTACTAILGSCGGGSSASSSPNLPQPAAPLVRVSQASPYNANCGGAIQQSSVLYQDAEVEPYEAVNPANTSNVIGIWQQDRWSDGGAHGLVAAYSMDGGKTWKEQPLPMSTCGSITGANYPRASDPWVSFSPDGAAYAISISFSGISLTAGSSGAVLVTRSGDGGVTWSTPIPLITDGASAFNDKESVTADPNNSNYAYAVWDRLDTGNRGPTYFSRTIDGGVTWSLGQPIYDPGVGNQTLGNEVIGLTDGSIVDLFDELDGTSGNTATSSVRVIRSTDHGTTWSAPVTVAENFSVGTADPNTGMAVRAGAGLPQGTAAPAGGLVVVWQDGRFSNFARDGIALSRSSDGGQTWTTPVEINSVTTAPAFTPSVAVLGDGTIGVSYFDFRNNTSDRTALLTDYWFTSSTDGVHWSEQHISGPFDLDLAPHAEGLFLGDYQALAVVANVFTPFYVQTNNAGTADRTDAYVLPPQPIPLVLTRRVTNMALAAGSVQPTAAARGRVHENLMQLLRGEVPGWDKLREARRAGTVPP
ncbi:MAG TPA: sialidase family protein [Gammaproteobacteria bacterium]|nr:sialidase family protein [Gammaproteobacteria bacterium]